MATLGIVGSGKTTRKNVKLLLNDLAEREQFTKLVVPGDDLLCTDSVKYVVDWAVGQSIPVTVVTTDHYNVDHLIDLKALDGVGVIQNRDPVARVAEADTVLLAWDETDVDFLTEVVHQVMDNGGYALDLTDQLFPLEDSDYVSPAANTSRVTDSSGATLVEADSNGNVAVAGSIKKEESVVEEEVKPARRKRRTKAEMAADQNANIDAGMKYAEETTGVPMELPASLAAAFGQGVDEAQNLILTVDPSSVTFVPDPSVWDNLVPTDEDVLVALKVLRAFFKGA